MVVYLYPCYSNRLSVRVEGVSRAQGFQGERQKRPYKLGIFLVWSKSLESMYVNIRGLNTYVQQDPMEGVLSM